MDRRDGWRGWRASHRLYGGIVFVIIFSKYRACIPNKISRSSRYTVGHASTSQITALQARELDAGIVRTPPSFKPPADITATRLLTDPLVVAVDPTHHLHAKCEINLSELRNE